MQILRPEKQIFFLIIYMKYEREHKRMKQAEIDELKRLSKLYK